MSNAVIVAIEVGDGCLAARSRIGAQDGPEVFLAAPGAPGGGAGWWDSAEAHELVLEALAVQHLPRIDTLVFATGDESAALQGLLSARYAGRHVVRNTECRSQTLTVDVRAVRIESATGG